MKSDKVLVRSLRKLQLMCIRNQETAGLLIASVPVPRNAPVDWTLAGRPTFVKPLGKWYDAESPRRLLMVADSGGDVPDALRLARGAARGKRKVPVVEMETFAHAPAGDLPLYYWERSQLTITWGGKSIGLAMGLRVKEETHWWEACNLVVKSQSPTCVEVEMGGTIPYEVTTGETYKALVGKDNLYVHKHNWVSGHLYARLHSNGVCEIYAHHVNSMFCDEGADFKNAVPVIGFKTAGGEKVLAAMNAVWDGSCREMNLGGIAFDLTDVARLATAQKPGRLYASDGFVVLQPYRGVELCGGDLTKQRIGDDFWWRAEQEIFPRGMARTLRFSLSLTPERSPRVARYIAPAYWYGLCEEFQPRSILPVVNEYDETPRTACEWYRRYMIPAGFEEGVTPWDFPKTPDDRLTPSIEGDIPGGVFLTAYRSGDAATYDCAMRGTYAIADVFVDHAAKHTRMMGHQASAVAMPLQRMHGPILGWLETGDLYLLNTAEAVIDSAYWWHKNSWPRRAIGRDARFVHSQMVLYRYLGDRHYLERSRDVIADLAAAQWPNGGFGDQGGGSGIHGHAAYIIKPWMGCLATFVVMDYLEQVPDDATALSVVKKFVDFLMRERAPRLIDRSDPKKGKAMGWTYQHLFKGKRLPGYSVPAGPTMGAHLFHLDYLARLLGWYSFKSGDPKYFEAFLGTYRGAGAVRDGAYHHGTSAFQCIPWLEDRLWNATVTKRGVAIEAMYLGAQTPKRATIRTPDGDREVVWIAPGKLQAPKDVRCKVVDLAK